jgi:hypothetical protein
MFRSQDLSAGEQAQMDQNVATARGMVETLVHLAHEVHHRTDDEVMAYSAASTWLTGCGIARPELIPDDDKPEEPGEDGRLGIATAHGMGMLMLINAVQQLAELQDAYMALHDEKEDLEAKLDNAIGEVERLSTNREFDDITALFDPPSEPSDEPEGTQE